MMAISKKQLHGCFACEAACCGVELFAVAVELACWPAFEGKEDPFFIHDKVS